jgi:HKD family nuclease
MQLILHTPTSTGDLSAHYKKAFEEATELFIVTAYLTEWDDTLELNDDCKRFRIIIGKDFGITKKVACQKVMRWLPPSRKSQFMVADEISGFHPKAVFWKDSSGQFHSIIGSSNLTRAAFGHNYEANIYTEISKESYIQAKNWVREIEGFSLVVSEDWLSEYQEGISSPRKAKPNRTLSGQTVIPLVLPRPRGSTERVRRRRARLERHEAMKEGLHQLFRSCAEGKITSEQFYQQLPKYWCSEKNRLQAQGWERSGRDSDFQMLAKSFISILDAPDNDRDDVVVQEIDYLAPQLDNSSKVVRKGIPTRGAFLSEILCLAFPDSYPVLNKPVKAYLSHIKFKSPTGASEGSQYLDLAKKLRLSLLQNPKHPAKNLAELDTVIWLWNDNQKRKK